jgi:RNA polymerase sigma-70 factor (ECF subfamily)
MNAGDVDQLLGHAAWLRRFAAALVRDPDAAEDVAQGTLIAAWQHPPAAQAAARPWLATVARNQARDLGRSGRRREAREEVAAALLAEPATPEQLVGDVQIHRALAETVTALEEPYRTTVFLRYYEGLSAADIASREGIPPGTVRWRLKEGLERIRRALDARHGGDRKRWIAALAPLVPLPALAPAGSALVSAAGRAASPLVRAAIAGVLGTTALVAWLVLRTPAPPPAGAVATAVEADPAVAGAPARPPRGAARSGPAPRLAAPAPELAGGAAGNTPSPVPENPEVLLRHLLAATEANAYEDFLLHASDEMKAAMGKAPFEEAVAQLAPLLRRGFEAEPLGTIRQEGHVVHLWKLVFTGAPADDALARLAIADGRVAGFLVE